MGENSQAFSGRELTISETSSCLVRAMPAQ
jgi:hypothetical protein